MTKETEPRVEAVDLDGMREYLRGTEVVFALLFGSHAQGTAEPSSDVDVALRFSDDMDNRDRFRLRNRIDAEVQQFADRFVDVSDIDSLPTSVSYAAVRDGVRLVGDEADIDAYRERVTEAYEDTADERKRDREEFIDRLAKGDV